VTDEVTFLPFDTAVHLVGAIQEEEHIQEPDRRIFTVYDRNDRELCWFDADETIAVVAPGQVNPKKDRIQAEVEKYILSHIPAWVIE